MPFILAYNTYRNENVRRNENVPKITGVLFRTVLKIIEVKLINNRCFNSNEQGIKT